MSEILGIITYGVGVLLICAYYLAWKWGTKAESIDGDKSMITDVYASVIEDDTLNKP